MKTFYDPHPGIGGAAVPLPEHVRIVAEHLDGQTMELDEARQMIVDAVRGLGIIRHEIKPLEGQSADEGCILLKVWPGEENFPQHCWRVIRFLNEEEES